MLGIFMGDKFLKPFSGKTIPTDLEATLLDRAKPIQPFKLIDHNNKSFDHTRFSSKWSFMFFGYTHCPDVCPTAMQTMKTVWKQLDVDKQSGSNLQMIFVSVDPERDDLDTLKQYATFYHPDYIGVTGKLDQIDNITRQLGILYGYEEPDEKGNYHVNHSGQIILVDPRGNMRGVFSPPLDPLQISKDFLKIKDYVE